ncbi:MAG TPA: hypothetical protein VIJ92_07645 [Ginsengibacter sp.]
MNTQTKIRLSPLETELVQNREWILTKHSIIKKVYEIFGEMLIIYKDALQQKTYSIADSYKLSGGKISKGENYMGLPYVILDYPASFTKEDIFAIRTFFWWGNFFSISLHVSGKRFLLTGNFSNIFLFLQQNKFYICVNEDEWQYDFDPSNYIAVSHLSETSFKEILKRNFFKISKNLELNRWDEAQEFLKESFEEIIEFLKINFPDGEKDPSPGFPKAGSDL